MQGISVNIFEEILSKRESTFILRESLYFLSEQLQAKRDHSYTFEKL